MAFQRLYCGFRYRIPEPDGVVIRPRSKKPAIWREGYSLNRIRMALQRLHCGSGCRTPKPDGPVTRPRGKEPAIWRKSNCVNPI